MTTKLRNPRFSNAEQSHVDVDVEVPKLGWVRTTIDLNVREDHIGELFDSLNENISDIAPYVESVVDIEVLKSTKVSELEHAARASILSGFVSAALGQEHHYGGKETDQINLIGAASSGADMLFPCADMNDTWDRRQHTAEQLKQVLADGSLYKQSVLVALDQRRLEIQNATDIDSIDSVTWLNV